MFHNEAAEQEVQLINGTEIPRKVVLFLNLSLIGDRNLLVEIYKNFIQRKQFEE